MMASGAWLGLLMARAPNELTRTHRRMAARSNTALPPGRELIHSHSTLLSSLLGGRTGASGSARTPPPKMRQLDAETPAAAPAE